MKNYLLITGSILLTLFLVPSYAIERSAKQIQVEKYFHSAEEQTAKDALWTATNIFKVAVYDDGSSRNSYAMYVCEVLKEKGFYGVSVQIIDVIKLNSDGKWVKLGGAKCN